MTPQPLGTILVKICAKTAELAGWTSAGEVGEVGQWSWPDGMDTGTGY